MTTASDADLRSFPAAGKGARPSDLLRVEHEVDPEHETAAILTLLEGRQRSPILYFEHVRGCGWRRSCCPSRDVRSYATASRATWPSSTR